YIKICTDIDKCTVLGVNLFYYPPTVCIHFYFRQSCCRFYFSVFFRKKEHSIFVSSSTMLWAFSSGKKAVPNAFFNTHPSVTFSSSCIFCIVPICVFIIIVSYLY